MREIKFRFWDKDDVKFVERPENVVMLGDGKIFDDWRDFEDYIETNSLIVSQFTGLTDKNGVEIYEGDIVELKGSRIEIVELKEVEDGYMGDKVALGYDLMWRDFVVVGNIYENPELLPDPTATKNKVLDTPRL